MTLASECHDKLYAILAAIPENLRCEPCAGADSMGVIDCLGISLYMMSQRTRDISIANEYAKTVAGLHDEIAELRNKLRIPDPSRDFVNECNDALRAKDNKIKALEDKLKATGALNDLMRKALVSVEVALADNDKAYRELSAKIEAMELKVSNMGPWR